MHAVGRQAVAAPGSASPPRRHRCRRIAKCRRSAKGRRKPSAACAAPRRRDRSRRAAASWSPALSGQPPCATMPLILADRLFDVADGLRREDRQVRGTLSPWLACASNLSSQLPRRSDFRISPITSCCAAQRRGRRRSTASMPAPDKKETAGGVHRSFQTGLFACVGLGRARRPTILGWPTLTICQPYAVDNSGCRDAIADHVPQAQTPTAVHRQKSSEYGRIVTAHMAAMRKIMTGDECT